MKFGFIFRFFFIFSIYRLTAFESATSSERRGGSSSLFHKVRISVLMLSRFSMSYR